MNTPGAFNDPEVTQALDEACQKIVSRGILLGCYAESDFDLWRRRGVKYMSVKNDTNALLEGLRAAKIKAAGE